MSMWQRKLARRRRFNGQEGQSLVETAIAMPLLLGLAITGATTSNAAVQVCSSSIGVNTGTGVALCSQFGPAYTFPTPAADPEQPVYVLDRVDVEYTVTPIIRGTAFMVILPSNLKFRRQVSMRSLY